MSKKINEYISKRIGDLEKEAFSINYENEEDYDFYYISNRDDLVGFYLNSGLSIKHRTKCTMSFCRMIHEKFGEVDEIDLFNTFQRLLRAILEKDGINTLSDKEYNSMEGKVAVLKAKPLVVIPFINKVDLYSSIFKGRICKDDPKEKKVYLFFNPTTNKIKIGNSKITSSRGRTLMSNEPELRILCSWLAPVEVELALHEEYKSKRGSGEWFNLNPRDLKQINETMKGFKKVEFCGYVIRS